MPGRAPRGNFSGPSDFHCSHAPKGARCASGSAARRQPSGVNGTQARRPAHGARPLSAARTARMSGGDGQAREYDATGAPLPVTIRAPAASRSSQFVTAHALVMVVRAPRTAGGTSARILPTALSLCPLRVDAQFTAVFASAVFLSFSLAVHPTPQLARVERRRTQVEEAPHRLLWVCRPPRLRASRRRA